MTGSAKKLLLSEITEQAVEDCREAAGTHRVSFTATRANEPKRSSGRYVGTFHIPGGNCVEKIFETDTGLQLWTDNFKPLVRWRSIRSEDEFIKIDAWARRQGRRVFLRDCLELSVALDIRSSWDGDQNTDYTPIGALEYRAKFTPDEEAIEALVGHFCAAIVDLPFYRDALLIAAVPPRPGKSYDLPQTLAARIAERLPLINVTPQFQFVGRKGLVKQLTLKQKWAAWEQSGLTFTPPLPASPSVILIDDIYQSGTSLQFVASRLRAAGAGAIYGLCAVKTSRDTDNA